MAAVEEIRHRVLPAVSNITSTSKARKNSAIKFMLFYLIMIGLLLATCFLNVTYLGAKSQSSFIRYSLIICPAVPVLMLLFLFRRFLKLTDELHRNIIVRGLLWGLSAMMLIIIPWGFLELMRPDMPSLSAFYLLQIFAIVGASGILYGHLRSGAYSKSQDFNPWREPKS